MRVVYKLNNKPIGCEVCFVCVCCDFCWYALSRFYTNVSKGRKNNHSSEGEQRLQLICDSCFDMDFEFSLIPQTFDILQSPHHTLGATSR